MKIKIIQVPYDPDILKSEPASDRLVFFKKVLTGGCGKKDTQSRRPKSDPNGFQHRSGHGF